MGCIPWVPITTTARFVLEAANAVLGCMLPEWIYSMLRTHMEHRVGHTFFYPRKLGVLT